MKEYAYPLSFPGVYVFLSGRTVLYVGSAENVYSRAGNVSHRAIKKLRTLGLRPDTVRIYRCRNYRSSLRLEAKLIAELKPVANETHNSEKQWKKRTKKSRERHREIRSWAETNGLSIRKRGRLPNEIVRAYNAKERAS